MKKHGLFSGITALILAALLLAVSLGACSALPEDGTERAARLGALEKFSLRGKIAIFGERGKVSAYLNIDSRRPDYTIYLTGVSGTTLLKIDRNRERTEITDDKGRVTSGPDSAELFYRVSGYRLPCDDLADILTANPSGRRADYNIAGAVETVDYDGFTVTYRGYTRAGGLSLPKRVDIKGENFLIKITVNRWEM